jgi:surfeit locus 1 family protein
MKTSEYRPFKVKGRFLHDKEITLKNRHDLTGTNNQVGSHVITPFEVSDKPGMVILVNRGHVPFTHVKPSTRQAGQVEGEVEIVGLLRCDDKQTSFTPPNIEPFTWYWRDVQAMAKVLNTWPIFLDATLKTSNILGGPVGGQTNITVRNEHLSYIITWFSLSALTSFMWLRRYGRIFLKF